MEMTEVLQEEHTFFVVADRACGLEDFCLSRGVNYERIVDDDNAGLSAKIQRHLQDSCRVDYVLMLFSRLVTKELYSQLPTLNIHPSLLPAFAGFGAVKKARSTGVCFLGATLHLADSGMDAGPIIGQVSMPVTRSETRQTLEKYSFIQKLYLAILLVDLLEHGGLTFTRRGDSYQPLVGATRATSRCNPAIRSPARLDAIRRIEKREGVEVIE